MLGRFLKRHSESVMVATIFSSVVSAIVAVICVWLTIHYGDVAQTRQARLEELARFQGSTSALATAGGEFIAAINQNKDLAKTKVTFNGVIGGQIAQSEQLSKLFASSTGPIREYQDTLVELTRVIDRTSSPTDMVPWAESFGRVLDAKTALSGRLYRSLDVKN